MKRIPVYNARLNMQELGTEWGGVRGVSEPL